MFSRIQSVHFIGIGGTAMASVAAALREKGVKVTGSDQNIYPPMSTFLAERQIEVNPGYAEPNLAHRPDLVVIGNAISRGNPEAEYVLDHKLPYCSLPELLKYYFLRGKRSVVVAGTHGKTTVTALLAWVFEHNGLNPSYLIGGIPNNFSQGARFTDSEWFILEGDEYDTAFFDKRSKFVHYLPEVAIINNLEFEIPSFKFRTNFLGEINVRNALAVVACAKHCGLKNQQIQSAFDTFKGIKRRLEVRGLAGGVIVLDDFGHHPTAIRATLSALRQKYPTQRVWAIFEPRTNTTRRRVFQAELAGAFAEADAVVIAQVDRLELLAPEERLDPERLMRDLRDAGKEAVYLPDADAIAAHVAQQVQGGEVVIVFSNGGFGGLHGKLLARLGRG